MVRVVFLDRGTFAPELDLQRPDFAHEWVEYDATPLDAVIERAAGATAIITNKVPLRARTLAALPDLKIISIAATGHDVIDLEACKAHSVRVAHARGYAAHTASEHAFALIFALRRGLMGYRADVLAGEWARKGQFCFHTHPIHDLHGATLGLIGTGAIGGATADIAKALGMRVLYAGRKGEKAPAPTHTAFDEVLAQSDVISLHCPLNESTRNLLDAPEFAQMTRKPLIINTARGGLVNEAAMADALEAGQISGVGFDVLTSEPPAPDNPLMRIAHRPDVIITPHIAWASREAQRECWRQTIENIENFMRGAPSNILV